MAVILGIPILSALLIIQSAVLSRIPLLQGTADLIMLAVTAWALQKRVQTAWHWCLMGGLMVSYVSALPFGVPLASYLLTVGLALLLRQRVWQVPIVAMIITTFFGTLIYNIFAFISLALMGTPLPLLQSLNLVLLPSLLLNLLLALPFYVLLGDLAKWLYPEELAI